jgi:hypothetical protein
MAQQEPFAAPAELQKLRALQAQWERLWEFQKRDYTVARKLWEDHQEELVQKLLAGEDILTTADAWDYKDFSAEVRAKALLAQEACRRVANVARPLCNEILVRVAVRAEKHSRLTPDAELKLSKALGIAFRPSTLTVALARLAKQLREGVELRRGPAHMGESPQQQLMGAADLT